MADLGQQTKKMDIALKYTGGNMQLAKNMIAGKYNDLYCIKGKIEIKDGLQGLFVMNLFFREAELFNMFVAIGTSKQYVPIKPFLPLVQFAKDFAMVVEKNPSDPNTLNLLQNGFRRNLKKNLITDIIKACDKKNLEIVTRLMTQIVSNSLGSKTVRVMVDSEEISTFQWEVGNLFDGKLQPMSFEVPLEEGAENKKTAVPVSNDVMESPDIKDFERKYDKVLDVGIQLSPVKGINMDDLMLGDKIRVILPMSGDADRNFAKARGAMDADGNLKPIAGVYRKTIVLPGNGGYLLYADLPGRILCRAYEETKVKVALAEVPERLRDTMEKQQNAQTKKSGIVVIFAITVVVLLGVVISLIM